MPNSLPVPLTLEQTVEQIYNTALWNGKRKPFFFVTGAGVSAGIGGVPLSHDMIEVCRRSLSEEAVIRGHPLVIRGHPLASPEFP